MYPIQLLTDSTSDIPQKLIGGLPVKILDIPIAVEGKEYAERTDFTHEEFYALLERVKEVPTTAHINAARYLEAYRAAAASGARELINVTINAKGSACNDAARLAADMFREQEPDSGMHIHVLDSGAYSMAYGHPVLEAAKMARAGDPVEEILAYLRDFLDHVEIYLSCLSLDFAKRSGRISSSAAFVGEMLGLRPIIRMARGGNEITAKVRGDKNVPSALCNAACAAIASGGVYYVMRGALAAPAEELAGLMTKHTGRPPEGVYTLGPCVTVNAGPKAVAAIVAGKRRA